MAYDYDLAGNRTEIADSFGGAVSMTYDGAGRLGSLTTSAGPVSIGHDLSGRLASVLFPSNGSAQYDYDANGRLATVGHFDSQDAILAFYTMGYDLTGNITSIVTARPNPLPAVS